MLKVSLPLSLPSRTLKTTTEVCSPLPTGSTMSKSLPETIVTRCFSPSARMDSK